MTVAVNIEGLSKSYKVRTWPARHVHALSGLTLSVDEGMVYGLLGPNGAGKSTTIKILLNLIRPSAGKATVFGFEPAATQARKMLGFLPENPAPYEYLTGEEFVRLGGQLCGLGGATLTQRTRQVIERVEMAEASRLQIRRYSKGMIQRISLAQALVTEPKLLVLDEPTSGLDVLGRKLIRDIILEQRKRGTTIIFCSHIIPDVEALCDRVAVLIGGKLVKEGSVETLLSGEKNEMEATVEGVEDGPLDALGATLTFKQRIGQRVLVRFDEAQTHSVLSQLLQSGARVTRLQPSRFSLEDLFMQTLAAGKGSTVGGQIS
jgi:ABC-2 type transport system ATP-binding protein